MAHTLTLSVPELVARLIAVGAEADALADACTHDPAARSVNSRRLREVGRVCANFARELRRHDVASIDDPTTERAARHIAEQLDTSSPEAFVAALSSVIRASLLDDRVEVRAKPQLPERP